MFQYRSISLVFLGLFTSSYIWRSYFMKAQLAHSIIPQPCHEGSALENVAAPSFSGHLTKLHSQMSTSERLRVLLPIAYLDSSQTSIPDVWNGPSLFKWSADSKIPTMTNVTCKFLFLAGLAMSSDDEVAIEFGSWVGHSSSCLAAGLMTSGLRGRLHCYDMFKWTGESDLKGTHWNDWTAKDGTRMGVPTLLPIFISIVHRIDPFVTPHVGNMAHASVSSPDSWGNKDVGIFAIDSAKQWNQVVEQTKHGIWSKLKVGGLLIMMDFAKHACQIFCFYTHLVPSGKIKNEYAAFTASPWAFSILEPLSNEDILKYEYVLKSPSRHAQLLDARSLLLGDIQSASTRQRAGRMLTHETSKLVLKAVDACIRDVRRCAS